MGFEYDPKALSFWLRWILKISPKLGIKILMRHSGKDDFYERAHKVFSNTKTIDLFPLSGHHRGLIMVIDNKTGLFFYQDSDHFKYNGWETGEYAKGDPKVFDTLSDNAKGPYDLD